MKIDYSLPSDSKNYLYLDAQFRWGIRNILISLSELPLSVPERVFHMVIGLLELFPGLGLGLGLIDCGLQGRVQILHLTSDDPYQRGIAHGAALKRQIHFVYACVNGMIEQKIARDGNQAGFDAAVERLQRSVPVHLLFEMQGIAAAANVDMADVFRVHAFIDIYAGEAGCSTLATVAEEEEDVKRVFATNHFQSAGGYCPRFTTLQNRPVAPTIESHQEAMEAVLQESTIVSVVFDCNQREIHVANAWKEAAKTAYSTFSFFEEAEAVPDAPEVLFSANLDWPWLVLAPYLTLFNYEELNLENGQKKEKFVNLAFPGFIGTLRGINENGVAIGCCQSGTGKTMNGLPLVFVFREILENAKSMGNAKEVLEPLKPASSMNLTIAGKDGACVVEIDPSRSETGFAAEHVPH